MILFDQRWDVSGDVACAMSQILLMVLQAVGFNGLKASGQTLRLFCSESSYKVFPSKSKEYSCEGCA